MSDYRYIGPALYGAKKSKANGQVLDFTIIKVLFNGRAVEMTPNIKKDIDLINEGIWRILTTRKKERVYNRSFGCDLDRYVFEPLDDITAKEVQKEVFQALSNYEPRIRVNSVKAEKTNENELSVTLVYTVLLDKNYTTTSSFFIR